MSIKISRREMLMGSSLSLASLILAKIDLLEPPNKSDDLIRLQYNENPYGASPAAREAIQKALKDSNKYNIAAVNDIREAIAKKHQIPKANLTIGSGSTEILRAVSTMIRLSAKEIVTGHPTFGALPQQSEAIGTTVHKVPLNSELDFDLNRIGKKVSHKTGLIYICNPNNPTGKLIEQNKLVSFCEKYSKDTLILIDEAYHDFVLDSSYKSLEKMALTNPNILITRTFSKVHGIAALRVGYAIGQADTIKRLQNYVMFPLNIVGIRAAIASFSDDRFKNDCVKKNERSRRLISDYFDANKIEYVKSETNFIFFKTKKSLSHLTEEMRQKNIIVGRPFPPYYDWCRLSIGTEKDMQAFIKAYEEIYSS